MADPNNAGLRHRRTTRSSGRSSIASASTTPSSATTRPRSSCSAKPARAVRSATRCRDTATRHAFGRCSATLGATRDRVTCCTCRPSTTDPLVSYDTHGDARRARHVHQQHRTCASIAARSRRRTSRATGRSPASIFTWSRKSRPSSASRASRCSRDIENLPNLLNKNWGGLRQFGFPQTCGGGSGAVPDASRRRPARHRRRRGNTASTRLAPSIATAAIATPNTGAGELVELAVPDPRRRALHASKSVRPSGQEIGRRPLSDGGLFLLLQPDRQIRVERPLREGVEEEVFVVVDVIDAERRACSSSRR